LTEHELLPSLALMWDSGMPAFWHIVSKASIQAWKR